MQSRAGQADQRINGVVFGIVTSVEDPDELNRVEVELPWYRSDYKVWARVVQAYAGAGFGSTWIPEKECEVMVAFAHGDMRFPYVLGAMYSPVDEPPVARTASTDVKTWLTPNGLEMRFDETNKVVTIRTKEGAEVILDDGGSITLKSDNITIEAGSSFVVSSPDISIEGGSVAISGDSIALN